MGSNLQVPRFSRQIYDDFISAFVRFAGAGIFQVECLVVL
jgi:hypothetical protein